MTKTSLISDMVVIGLTAYTLSVPTVTTGSIVKNEYVPSNSHETKSFLANNDYRVVHSLAAMYPWLASFYEVSNTAASAKEIQPFVSGITDLYIENKFDIVNAIFEEMDVSQMSILSLITISRTAFRAKDKLNSWDVKFQQIKNRINELDYQCEKVLIGIV